MMIDYFAISKLKNFIYYDDKPILIKSCVNQYNQAQIDKDIVDVVSERQFSVLDNGVVTPVDENREEKFKKYIDENKTIYISDFECANDDAKKITDAVKESMSTEAGCYATCHLYMGKVGSESFDPHCDIPCNFIFQVRGKSRAIVYNNRCSTLMAAGTIFYSERKHKIYYEELQACLDVVLEPGDALYIPAKQYHAIIPLEDRISFSIPIVSYENWYNHQQRLE